LQVVERLSSRSLPGHRCLEDRRKTRVTAHLFDRDDLQRLLASHETPCVSLFLPTHRHPPQSDQDPVRLRNLVKEAEAQLASADLPEGAESLLEPVIDLARSRGWAPPRDGLAVFRSPDFLAHYPVPMTVPERVVVADTFHVRPLLRFLQRRERYYLLALSQKDVRLYEGTPFALEAVDVDLPASLHEALGSEHDPAFLNLHATGRGSETAAFHGHGDAEDTREEDLKRFFRAVDAATWPVLRHEKVPLFLAGIGRYVPLYRQVCRYPHVVDEGLEGNVDGLGIDTLLERVQPLAEDLFRHRRQKEREEFSHAHGRGLTELDLHALGRHAVQGRVRRLLLGEGREVWGSFDFESGRIRTVEKREALSDDVLDDLAQAVLLRDGEVATLPFEEMPEGASAAALLRW
jgi:hypothetical protein